MQRLFTIRHSFLALLVLAIATSCSVPKNITYFQDLESEAILQTDNILDIKVKPEDKLSITVTTQDPALNQLFNLVTTQNRLEYVNTLTTSGQGSVAYYTVAPDGDINFPVVGKIHIAGLTRSEVADKIYNELTSRNLVKDPIVTVEFANAKVSVLGEVLRPGKYNFNEDHVTILDAIAMAGDLTNYGVRDNVLVVRRNSMGEQQAYRVSLLDAKELAKSPVYYLQQDDVIYVEPNDKKKRETTPNGNSPYTPSFWVSIGSFATTIATLIISLSK